MRLEELFEIARGEKNDDRNVDYILIEDTTHLTRAHLLDTWTSLFRIFIASESSILLVCYTTYKCLLKIARRVETIIRSVNINCDSMVNT